MIPEMVQYGSGRTRRRRVQPHRPAMCLSAQWHLVTPQNEHPRYRLGFCPLAEPPKGFRVPYDCRSWPVVLFVFSVAKSLKETGFVPETNVSAVTYTRISGVHTKINGQTLFDGGGRKVMKQILLGGRMKTSTLYICFLLTLACLTMLSNSEAAAQALRVKDIRDRLRLVKTFDLLDSVQYQTIFTVNDDLFVTMKNPANHEWSYQLGSVRLQFLPCAGKDYGFGDPNNKNNLFAIGCPDSSIELWDLNTARLLSRFTVRQWRKIEEMDPRLSPDGKQVLVRFSGIGTEAELWNSDPGKHFATLTSESTDCDYCNRTVYDSRFSPDGRRIAVSFGGIVHIWDSRSGEMVSRLMDDTVHVRKSDPLADKGIVGQLLFTADGKKLITGSYFGTAKVWDVESGKLLFTFSRHGDRVTALAISPDGRTLATGSRDNHFKLWNIESGELILTSSSIGQEVKVITFSQDGKRLMTISDDRIMIWETSSGQLLEKTNDRWGDGIRFSNDWRHVLIPDKKKHTVSLYEYPG